MTELSENLVKLRNKNGLSQAQLAEILEISQQAYGRYELGTREPDLKTLIRIANYYNITLDLLAGRKA